MDSLIFAINAVAPIILMVVIGYLLKKKGFMSADFARAANKLVFRIFLPSMLFLNVYKIGDIGEVKLGYIFYVVAVLIALFAVALPLVIVTTKHSDRRGALLQAVFRSNYALIGIPLAQSLCGDDGVAIATLLSVVSIPLLNVLAVISLSLFREDGGKPSVKKILLDIAKKSADPVGADRTCRPRRARAVRSLRRGIPSVRRKAPLLGFDLSFQSGNPYGTFGAGRAV